MNPVYPSQGVPAGIASGGTGPVDRESFFTAQRRYRRQTWRLSLYSLVAVFLAGIPLSITLTPILFAVVLAISGVINQFSPLPGVVTQTYHDIAYSFIQFIGWRAQAPGYAAPSQTALLIDAAVLILPGAIALLFLWTVVLAVFERAGVGGILLSLGARPPRLDDFKERQLVNIVAEMALAAGIQTPRLALLDNGEPNAAFIGTCEQDAVVVVSRQLLDQCSRDETQGMVAHVIAAIGNGDLNVAFRVVSIKLTQMLAEALVSAPFYAAARSTVGGFLRLAFKRRSQAKFAIEAEQFIQLMVQQADSHPGASQARGCSRTFDAIMRFVLLPLIIAYLAVLISSRMADLFLIAPPICRMWRTRRLLADAAAVQLTRNPNALAGALQRITDRGGSVQGGALAAHLFVTWPRIAGRREARLWGSVHPRISLRLKRLHKLGSAIEDTRTGLLRTAKRRQAGIGSYLLVIPLLIILFALIVLLLLLILLVILLVIGLEMGFMSIFLLGDYSLFFRLRLLQIR